MSRMIVFCSLLLAAACGGSPPPAEPTPAAEPIAAADPSTPVASSDPATATPAAAGEPTPCSLEIAKVCPAGEIDGCLRQAGSTTGTLTAYHVCMPDNQKVGLGCDKEIALQCATGYVDACLATPAASEFHLCVAAQ